MAKIIYDLQAMKIMTLFESITHAKLKDCILEKELALFVVDEGEIGKAIGKKGFNVKKLERMLKRKIKIVEYSPNIQQFIKNLVHPAQLKDIKEENDVITLVPADLTTRGVLIGRNASALRFSETIIKRYFTLKELKVQ